jgi:hypothetical protein
MERTGYTFGGWTPEVGPLTEDYTVFEAQWKDDMVTYLFDWGFDGAPENSQGSIRRGETPTPPAPTIMERTGYTFGGWTPEVGPLTADHTVFTAQWTPLPKFTVTYNANSDGGEVPEDENEYLAGDDVEVLPPTEPEINDYRFIVWTALIDGSEMYFEPGDSFKMPAHHVTLFAQWEPIIDDPPLIGYPPPMLPPDEPVDEPPEEDPPLIGYPPPMVPPDDPVDEPP